MYYLGVDGGGTKTTALVCDEKLKEIITVTGVTINYYSAGLEAARKNMADIISGITEKTGISHFNAAFIGMSAISGAASYEETERFTRGIISADKTGMNSDIYIALRAASEIPAAAVICGTGSMAAAICSDGEILTAGGYGYILGDEGSGYSVAMQAIKAAVFSLSGAGEKTLLLPSLYDFYNVKTDSELIRRFYEPVITRPEIAAFAECVNACAARGDAVAKKVLSEQARLIALTAKALLKKTGEDVPLFCLGGLMMNSDIFYECFINEFKGEKRRISRLTVPPEFGAVIAAKEL